MNLKIKIALPLLALAGIFLQTGHAFADETSIPFSGTAYGQQIGLLHMDYATAKRPSADAKYDSSSYYVGATKQFYIPSYVGNAKNPDFTGPGNDQVVARISTVKSDCTVSGCLLKGFIWSDSVGWIVLDGKLINDAVNAATGFDPKYDDQADPLHPDPYPSLWYPRIKKSGTMTGLAWNKHTGWIILSSDLNFGTSRAPNQQGKADFGAWMTFDPSKPPLFLGEDQIGRPLHGYIWSEYLGWIKLGIESEDSFAFDFKTYTRWTPDDTPPYLTASLKPWFSVGVNTGYDPAGTNKTPTTIVWRHFAIDPQSGVNKLGSNFNISPIPGETDAKCLTPKNDAIVVTSSTDDTYAVDLTIPTIGNLQNTDIGYCKFRLTARILNGGSNLPTYIGTTFYPNPMPTKPEDIADIQDHTTDEIIVYVRAGNPDVHHSTVTASDSTTSKPKVLADGKQSFTYTVNLNDVAGNPIRDIHCGAPYNGDKLDTSMTPDPFDPTHQVPRYSPQFQYADCPNREVTLNAALTNQLLYDLTQPKPILKDASNNILPYSTPVKYSEVNAATTGIFLTDQDTLPEVGWYLKSNGYAFEFVSYAPSKTYSMDQKKWKDDLVFRVDQFEYKIANAALSATSKRLTLSTDDPPVAVMNDDPDTAVPLYTIDKTPGHTAMPSNSLSPAPYIDLIGKNVAGAKEKPGLITQQDPTGFLKLDYVNFDPAVKVDNPKLVSGTLQGTLSLGLPADLSFDVSNKSTKAIAVGANDGGLSVDHILAYGSSSNNPSVALMESHRITDVPDLDSQLAWSDPIQGVTRYEMVGGGGCVKSSQTGCSSICYETCTPENSPFRSFYQTLGHIGKDFCYYFPCTAPNTLTQKSDGTYDGTYAINGIFSIPQEFAPDSHGIYPDGKIDRTDVEDLKLNGAPDLNTPVTINRKINFTPAKFVPVSINDIQMSLFEDIAYRYGDQPFFSVFTSQLNATPYNVMDIGLQAKGTVAGEQIVTGRQYDTVGTESTKHLQEQIRRNVAQLTSGLTPCTIGGTLTLNAFPTPPSPCVTANTVNGTMIAYYQGDPKNTLVLDTGTPDGVIDAPEMPYTLIIKGGANLFIRSNLRYLDGKPKSSLGFILIAENIGNGAANVYISPDPTNLVGSLYAEGSLISHNNAGEDYYGGGKGDVKDLKNQLYWQGSLASRNTIAGAGIKKVPEGIKCLDQDTEQECAQRYDLDYIRRFTAVIDTANTTSGSMISNDGKFSGGGSCPAGKCSMGTLPTVVKLNGNQVNKGSSELSTFYIEPSSRTSNNPPPGFSTIGGQESTQTIR
jgi:hypothetical protein